MSCQTLFDKRCRFLITYILSQITVVRFNKQGNSLFIYKYSWSIKSFIFLQSLLSDPNPNSPANSMAAQLYKENRREYEKRVKACVEQSFIDQQGTLLTLFVSVTSTVLPRKPAYTCIHWNESVNCKFYYLHTCLDIFSQNLQQINVFVLFILNLLVRVNAIGVNPNWVYKPNIIQWQ